MNNPRGVGVCVAVLAACLTVGGGTARAQVPESQLETFLGLPQGSLTGLNNGPVQNGSAIQQYITVSAGSTLSFNYDFLTNEPPAVGFNIVNPFAFVATTTLSDFADTFSPLMTSSTPFALETGYQTYTTEFLTAGTFALDIGVVNVTDNQYSSGLLIDNLNLTGGTIINPSFETGDLTGYASIGNVSVVTAAYGVAPTDGTYQAVLSTGSVPEPSSIVLMALGGLGVLVASIRRRSNRPSSRS
jgi:hypothetical protein